MKIASATALGMALLISACAGQDDKAGNKPENRIARAVAPPADHQQPDKARPDAGKGALNLTEQELLDAELVGTDGTELGDVTALKRGPTGAVEGLLIEVEDSTPDRFVYLPLDGLAPHKVDDDWTIVTSLTRAQIAAMPQVAWGQKRVQAAQAQR